MNAALWDAVTAELREGHRCVAPTLPMGGHRLPVHHDADLSLGGLAAMVANFLKQLNLDGVTLVGNDTGGAIAQILVANQPQRIARVVLASCEAFDNMPPGLPGRISRLAGLLPGGLWGAGQAMRFGPLAGLPLTLGWLAKRSVPRQVRDSWFGSLRDSRAIRRDTRRFVKALDAAELIDAADRLDSFDRPALVVWASEDRVMPPEHAERLAALLNAGPVQWIGDSYTLLPLDQPAELARAIGALARRPA